MSEFYAYFCDRCQHSQILGFVGREFNRTLAICRNCSEQFYLIPEAGEELNNSSKPYQLLLWGKKWVDVSSKKGRIQKKVLQAAFVDSGIRIPVSEDIVQRGSELHLVYDLVFDEVSCPTCHRQGSLIEYWKYHPTCDRCKVGIMR
jgi:hypothetical protein